MDFNRIKKIVFFSCLSVEVKNMILVLVNTEDENDCDIDSGFKNSHALYINMYKKISKCNWTVADVLKNLK